MFGFLAIACPFCLYTKTAHGALIRTCLLAIPLCPNAPTIQLPLRCRGFSFCWGPVKNKGQVYLQGAGVRDFSFCCHQNLTLMTQVEHTNSCYAHNSQTAPGTTVCERCSVVYNDIYGLYPYPVYTVFILSHSQAWSMPVLSSSTGIMPHRALKHA